MGYLISAALLIMIEKCKADDQLNKINNDIEKLKLNKRKELSKVNKQKIEKAINYIQNMDLSVFVNKQEASDAVDLITSLLTQQLANGWIPSPPPTGTECLVQTVNDEIIHAYYAGDCKYHFVSYYDRVIQAKAKYWQTLPESYKEVSE